MSEADQWALSVRRSLYAAPSQECPSRLGCCRCARWCNWRRFHRGRYFWKGTWKGTFRWVHFHATEIKMGQEFLTQSSAVKWASLPASNSLRLWWWTGPPSWAGWTNPLKEWRSHVLMHRGQHLFVTSAHIPPTVEVKSRKFLSFLINIHALIVFRSPIGDWRRCRLGPVQSKECCLG